MASSSDEDLLLSSSSSGSDDDSPSPKPPLLGNEELETTINEDDNSSNLDLEDSDLDLSEDDCAEEELDPCGDDQSDKDPELSEDASEAGANDKFDPSDEDDIFDINVTSIDRDSPLYSGSSLTTLHSMVMILKFALRYQLTSVAFDDLIRLVSCMLPTQHSVYFKSLYRFKKLFLLCFPHIKSTFHQYCAVCHTLLKDNEYCHGEKNVKVFVTASVEEQLKAKFRDPAFRRLLMLRPSSTDPCISDIQHGKEYRKLSGPGGFLNKEANPFNLSFVLNTDGVSLFKSSNTSIWPIFLIINELPPSARFCKENLLLCGVWFDNEKPTMTTFLEPLVQSLQHLYEKGIDVNAEGYGVVKCRAVLVACTCDLPAKALVANMKQFSGAYSCSTCKDEGDNTFSSNRLHRVWPHSASNVIRDDLGVRNDLRKVVEKGKPFMGYKGVPILALCQKFDLVKGMVCDYMHCVMLGVTKMLLEKWFQKKNRGSDYYIGNKTDVVDSRLAKLRVPDFVKRAPRPIGDVKHWKATEFQAWLLWYSPLVLSGILPNPYYQHYCKLVVALSILLRNKLTETSIEEADALLDSFYSSISDLYGVTAQTANVHQLRHLTLHVRNWGPLWAYSCFGLESRNGDIRKLYHGTKNMSEQVLFTFQLSQCLPLLEKKLPLLPHHPGKKRKGRRTKMFSEKVWCVGSCKPYHLSGDWLFKVMSVCSFIPQTFFKFLRLEVEDTLIYSHEYTRPSKRNNYTIMYSFANATNEFGVVEYFLEAIGHNMEEVQVLALVRPFTTTVYSVSCVNSFSIDYIFESTPSEDVRFIPVSSILTKCVSLDVLDKIFVIKPIHKTCMSLSS